MAAVPAVQEFRYRAPALDSGSLAYSSGPVFDPKGKRVATFNSVWRREADGTWRVVFDKGCNACDCAKAQSD